MYSTGALPIATVDAYPNGPNQSGAPAFLACQGAVLVNLHIFNAGVSIQLADDKGIPNPRSYNFGAEFYRPPGIYSIRRRCNAIRFKSAVAGTPAQIAVEAMLPKELP